MDARGDRAEVAENRGSHHLMKREKGERKAMRRARAGAGALLAAALVLCLVGAAIASEATEHFVEEAEPICKTNVEANKRIFGGLRQEVKRDELKRASKHFFRAATAFGATIRKLAALPRPSEETARLSKWFAILKEVKALVVKTGRAFAAEEKGKATGYGFQLRHASNKANNAVIPFGFNYCRLEPSRFNG